MRLSYFLPLFCLTLAASGAGAVRYSNVINGSGWDVQASAFECRMSSSTELYGTAVFQKGAGEEKVEFMLDSPLVRMPEGPATLLAEAPAWRPEAGSLELGEITIGEGRRPIQLDQDWTARVLTHLLQGREVVVRHSRFDKHAPRLSFSSIAFRPAYNEYLACLAGLLPVNFDQIKRTSIYFPPDELEELPDDEAAKLDHILAYAEADPYLMELYVDGHTDSAGTREQNLLYSRIRARLVSEYLVKRGLPQERIVVRWHGERYPVVSNETPENRARNRRVTIRLERVEPIEVASADK